MKKLGKLLRNLLIVCGVLFIIVLLLPDEEEMPADQEQTSVETASAIGIQTGTETASGGCRACGGCSGKSLSGRYGKGETDRDKRRWKGPSDRICLYEWFGSGIGGRRGNGGSL